MTSPSSSMRLQVASYGNNYTYEPELGTEA